jgi:hypothetical protein
MEPFSDFDFVNVGGSQRVILRPPADPFAPVDLWKEINRSFEGWLNRLPEIIGPGYIGGFVAPEMDWKARVQELWTASDTIVKETGPTELRKRLRGTEETLELLLVELRPPPIPDIIWTTEEEYWQDVLDRFLLEAHRGAWPQFYAAALRAAVWSVALSAIERLGILPALPPLLALPEDQPSPKEPSAVASNPRGPKKRRPPTVEAVTLALAKTLWSREHTKPRSAGSLTLGKMWALLHTREGRGWEKRSVHRTLDELWNPEVHGPRPSDPKGWKAYTKEKHPEIWEGEQEAH